MRRDIDKVIFERAKTGRTWTGKTPRAARGRLDASGDPERFLARNVGWSWQPRPVRPPKTGLLNRTGR